MKKKILIILIVIMALIGVYMIIRHFEQKNVNWKGYTSINYTIDEKKYHLLVADDEKKRERGLMNVTKLDGYDGMIFIFPVTEYVTFWNKDTIADLNLYWINGDKVIGKDDLPSINKTKREMIIQSPGSVNKVVEIIK